MDSNTKSTVPKRILLVAEHRIGHGSGHLHRCARLAPRLKGEVDWLLPARPVDNHYDRAEALEMIGNPDLPVRWVDTPQGPYDMVILDRREITLDELQTLQIGGISVGIDLAGEGRRYCSFLIDALESPPGAERPNIADPGLLHLPEHIRQDWPERISRILVAFGGEQSGAGGDLAAEIAAATDAEVYLVTRESIPAPEGISLIEAKGDLNEKLADFDLVITHFGLTAYEALWAKVPVLLKNPSKYHSALARSAEFPEVRTAADVSRCLKDPTQLVDIAKRVRPNGKSDIAMVINELRVPPRTNSPGGGDRWQPAIQRFGERTFFKNSEDGLVYMQNYRGTTMEYGHDYFFTEYARQYGKTYLEDFPAIREMGRRRIRDILRRRRAGSERPRLLDIGCAFGPFLQAASDAGCDVEGIDVSCEATRYVKNELGFPARCADVLDESMVDLGGPFDIITMWYVIEHFQDLDLLLRRVAQNLKPGGLFAFSTPNAAGVSGRKDIREFYRRSPSDHYTVMTPAIAEGVLKRFGFVSRNVRITGHHPERFDFVPTGRERDRSGIRYRLAEIYSHMAKLGDTFEMIAEYRP